MIRFLAFGFVGLVLLVSCGDDLHSSNACTGDTDCALGAICTGGSCVPGCDDTHGCADALSCCSGVCIDVSSDVANCGACGSACSSENIATPTCSASVCNGECNVGTADCNGDKRTDGCETATTADGNCGACGATCNDTSCSTGVCLVQGGNGSCVAVDQSACATPACVLAQAGDCSAVDTDGDGLSDTWEKNGYIDMNCNGVNDAGDIQLLGADPAVRDIYVRYDYMATATHSHEPPPAALAQVAAAFATHQIHLHWLAPAGPLPGPDGMNSEYAVVSLDSSASTACAGSNFVTTATLRQNFFCNPANGGYPCSTGLQNPAYHYLVFGHDSTTPNSGVLAGACPSDPLCGGRPSAGSTGVSDVGGDDFIVSFGAYVDSGTQIGIELWAATTLHELGHNLTLVHGSLADAGDSAQACSVDKPNYVSVMNYAYQLGPIIPATAVGGDTPIDCTTDSDCGPPTQSSGVCATADACYCTDDLASFGGNICYRVDYSDQQ